MNSTIKISASSVILLGILFILRCMNKSGKQPNSPDINPSGNNESFDISSTIDGFIFTDNLNDLPGDPPRRLQGIDFNISNLGPIGDRIPVILIHGLRIGDFIDPIDEVFATDIEASRAQRYFTPLFDNLNRYYFPFERFKFFLYF